MELNLEIMTKAGKVWHIAKKMSDRLRFSCHSISCSLATAKWTHIIFHQSTFKHNSNFICEYGTGTTVIISIKQNSWIQTTAYFPMPFYPTPPICIQAFPCLVPPFGCVPLPRWRRGVRKTASVFGALPHSSAECSPTQAPLSQTTPTTTTTAGTQPWAYLRLLDMHLKISKCPPLCSLTPSPQTSLLICGERRMCHRRQFGGFFPLRSLLGSKALSLSLSLFLCVSSAWIALPLAVGEWIIK